MTTSQDAFHEGQSEISAGLNGISSSHQNMQPGGSADVNMDILNKLKVCDEAGRSIPLSDLYENCVLLIFIRHFMCGSCKDYVSYISAHQFSVPVKIIGCGDYSLIQEYRKETKCPYPVYADKSRQTYAHLGFFESLSQADKGEYMTSPISKSVSNVAMHPLQFMRSGNIRQNGGEMLMENGSIKWLHRMKTSVDHASIGDIESAISSE